MDTVALGLLVGITCSAYPPALQPLAEFYALQIAVILLYFICPGPALLLAGLFTNHSLPLLLVGWLQQERRWLLALVAVRGLQSDALALGAGVLLLAVGQGESQQPLPGPDKLRIAGIN